MSEFISNTYRAIDIIDGTDVQDFNLYNWLTENATQYNPASYCLINTNKYIARAHLGTSNISKMYLGEYNIFKSLPLLYTPTISLSGTNLTISTTDDNTYYFDIYANGTKVDSIETPDVFILNLEYTKKRYVSDTDDAIEVYTNWEYTNNMYYLNSTDRIYQQLAKNISGTQNVQVTIPGNKFIVVCRGSSEVAIDGSITCDEEYTHLNGSVYIDTLWFAADACIFENIENNVNLSLTSIDWDN